MREVVQNIIEYLDVIYEFSFAHSMVIMLILQCLYFGGMMLLKDGRKRLNKRVVFCGVLLTFYVSQVIGITLLNRGAEPQTVYNSQVFEVYETALAGNSVFMTQLLGNIVMFVPLGILLPICVRRTDGFFRMLLIVFGCSLAIEETQLLTHTGIFELVDLINNTVGGMLGYVVYRVCKFIWKIIRK